jgi:hypothetical protein
MAEQRLDPRSLAERLDEVLPPGRWDTPPADEDPLVEVARRLSASSPAEPIAPEARARIRSQVLNAYRQQTPPGSRHPSQTASVTQWVGVGIAVLVVLVVGLIVSGVWPDTASPSLNVTEEPILTNTATPTSVGATPAPDTPTPVESTPEVLPPTASPLPTTIVVEGTVEAVDANTITVFGIAIEVEPDDPTLAEIQVGDHVRVEGEMVEMGNTIIIVAVSITITDIDTEIIIQPDVQPPGNQPGPPIVVPPGCKITGIGNNNPRLKCSER